MRYKLLGKSGLRVSELCLGTMTFGEDWGWGASREESRQQFDMFMEAGGNFIDTANRYTEGSSERLLGEFIAADRERIVLASKYSLYDRLNEVNASGNHRKNMVQSLEGSLKRLGTDYVDVFWLHAWDYLTPIEEVLRGLDDLVRAGKILYIGISDTPAWIVSRANAIAELRGWTQFVGLQIEYSLIQRTPERELLPMAREMDIAVTAWAALGGGVLTGKYLKDSGEPRRMPPEAKRLNERNHTIARRVLEIADDIGCTPAQVAINWVRQHSQPVIPILGARTAAQLRDNLDSLAHGLKDEHRQALDEVSAIELGFPHDFLAGDAVNQLLYGGMRSQIDNHRL